MHMHRTGPNALKAVVFGATGATGRELVSELLRSHHWGQISIVTRRKLAEWDKLPAEQRKKLDYIMCSNFDELASMSEWSQLSDHHSVFCCLGANLLKDEQSRFYKVDHDYTLTAAKIAKENKVPHFSLISSRNANPKSMVYYMKVKGQTEEDIKHLNLPLLSIFRPGGIIGRYNDNLVVKSFKLLPFFPTTRVDHLAVAMKNEAEIRHLEGMSEKIDAMYHLKKHEFNGSSHYCYENPDIKHLAEPTWKMKSQF